MDSRWVYRSMVIFFVVCTVSGVFVNRSDAARYKVLVVMSYEEDFPWDKEIKEGIDSVLAAASEIRYFYMDTKKNPSGGEKKAKEAYLLYQKFQPDGVIACDDNAQSVFVVPYLKDKVKTPVMFSGVNAAPEKYGYPATNVSGILERESVKESLIFAKQLVPAIETFGFMTLNDATGNALMEQINSELKDYPLKFTGVRQPKTVGEALEMAEAFKKTTDLLLYVTLEGLSDQNGKPMTDKEIIPKVSEKFGKPMISNAAYRVKYGIFCAVVKTGQEQGTQSAGMLLKAMQGNAVKDIPITQNQFGRRIINTDILQSLGITPKAVVIRGAELVKTEP